MPKQYDPIKIKGTLDNISYYSDKRTGDVSRKKGGGSK